MASLKRPQRSGLVQFPVPKITSPRARSTAGEPQTSPHPAPVAPAPVDGAVTSFQRSCPVRASTATIPASNPFPELCTSKPKITLPPATTGDDSISVGSFTTPSRPIVCCQSFLPSDARSAYIVLPDGTKTVRTPSTTATAGEATI